MLPDNVRTRGGTLRAALAAAGIALFAAGSASAGTVVDEWDFSLNNGFTAFTGSAGVGPVTGSNTNVFLTSGPHDGPPVGCTPGPGCIDDFIPDYAMAPSKLSWGDPVGAMKSSIEVGSTNGLFDSASPGYMSILTDAPAVDTVKVFHNNQEIDDDSAVLLTATLTDVLTLTPKDPPNGSFFAPQLTFSIKFLETPNSTPCASTMPAGSPCNDIFVIDVAGAGFDPMTGTLVQEFMYDMEEYEAVITLVGLGPLQGTACEAVLGMGNTECVGLTTVEGGLNSFQTTLAINHLPASASEPGTLAVLGLGLLGLGVVRRRSRA